VARVRAIHLSPIKSLGLMSSERVTVTPDGIAGDRAFVLLDDRGEVATMRRYGALARAGSRFDPDSGRLVVVLPDGSEVSGTVGGEEPEVVLMFGRDVQGTIVEGPWSEALSELAGTPMRLMRVDNGHAQDTYPMSLLSQASLHELAADAGVHQNTLRPHVVELQQAGLLLTERRLLPSGRGRPGIDYRLSPLWDRTPANFV